MLEELVEKKQAAERLWSPTAAGHWQQESLAEGGLTALARVGGSTGRHEPLTRLLSACLCLLFLQG